MWYNISIVEVRMRPYPKDIPTSEEWLPVVGFELLYLISRWGQVFNLISNKILKSVMSTSGYLYVVLYKDGKPYNKYIHSLVMEAFIGSRPESMQVHHKDGDKTNNYLNNLGYTTRSKNIQYSYDNGRVPINHVGENNNQTHFRDKDIPVIRERRSNGETYQSIANDYGVHEGTIRKIVTGKNWGHIL